MDYETTDWELEAKRVALAFGLEGEFQFVCHTEIDDEINRNNPDFEYIYHTLRLKNDTRINSFSSLNGWIFTCEYYDQAGRGYSLHRPETQDRDFQLSSVGVRWTGHVSVEVYMEEQACFFAKALFHLGFLTPKVEEDLEVNISAHEKIEWTLEHEALWFMKLPFG